MTDKTPVRVAVTGAAGAIGYSLLFRIAERRAARPRPAGRSCSLLEITPALQSALEGVIMELDDCAFPLLAGVEATDDPNVAFDGRERRACSSAPVRAAQGMERNDLLEANGGDLHAAGQGAQRARGRDVKVLVVGNPANTNALIAAQQRARRADASASPR